MNATMPEDSRPRIFKLINGDAIIALATEAKEDVEAGWLISNPIELMLQEAKDGDRPVYVYAYSPINYLPLAKDQTMFLGSSKILLTSLANDNSAKSYLKMFSPIEIPTAQESKFILSQ